MAGATHGVHSKRLEAVPSDEQDEDPDVWPKSTTDTAGVKLKRGDDGEHNEDDGRGRD